MFHELDVDIVTRIAGTAWMIVVGLLTLILGLLAILLPFFVWRIVHWTRASAQELARLNTRMEHLLTHLAAARGRAGENGDFTFARTEEAPERRERPREPKTD